MIKLIKKFVFPLLFLVSSSTFAGLITTDLAENTYISYEGYDWTWASSVNVTDYDRFEFSLGRVTNTFEDASFHTGWMEIVNTTLNPELEQLFSELTLDLFSDGNGGYVNSLTYWNSTFTEVNSNQFNSRLGQKNDEANSASFYFETFYVRNTPSQVPEPATIMIFAIALIALSLRKRAIK